MVYPSVLPCAHGGTNETRDRREEGIGISATQLRSVTPTDLTLSDFMGSDDRRNFVLGAPSLGNIRSERDTDPLYYCRRVAVIQSVRIPVRGNKDACVKPGEHQMAGKRRKQVPVLDWGGNITYPSTWSSTRGILGVCPQ